ncbi:MAG: hypothetical protein Ct9H90mP11_01330 [Acidimicrobiales bacterium]|nr:MAG: hypothetical protein Ct9H90mP11_01330 [Acidimicrobiales bacterium]
MAEIPDTSSRERKQQEKKAEAEQPTETQTPPQNPNRIGYCCSSD